MATNFPSSLDTLTNPTSTDTLNSPDHAAQHANANDALEALEAKVGVDSSAVTTSHDYKLSGVTGSDKAASKTGSETLTNKTLTSPKINVGSDATGDIHYRDGSGNFARLGIGSTDQILQVAAGLPSWQTNPTIANTPTADEKAALVGTSGSPGSGNKYVTNDDTATSGANKVLRLNGSGQLPALDASNLTNVPATPLDKVVTIGAAEMYNTAGATATMDETNMYNYIILPNGTTNGVIGAVKVPKGCTSISSIIFYAKGTATGGNWTVNAGTSKIDSDADGAVTTDSSGTATNFAEPGTIGNVSRYTLNSDWYGALGSIDEDDIIHVRISRTGGGGGDTSSGELHLLAIQVTFA